MTCTAKVKNGAIRLPDGITLPEGSEVQVSIPDHIVQPAFAERYAAYIGAAQDLPADLAENIDHYIHGHAKK